jgi:hypothetical protein
MQPKNSFLIRATEYLGLKFEVSFPIGTWKVSDHLGCTKEMNALTSHTYILPTN